MPLAPVATKPVKYQGCPPGCRHAVFVKPDGQEVAALLTVDPSWTLSLFVEAEFHRFFLVATSPDGEQLRIERWLPRHGPTRLEAATQAEQAAALGGAHAGNSTAAELADAAVAQLTASDTPAAVPPRVVQLVPINAPNPADPNPRVKRGDYTFLDIGEEPSIRCRVAGILNEHSHKTKGLEGELAGTFQSTDARDAYYLFDTGSDYLLECLRFWGGRFHRLEATGTKVSLPGTPQDVVEALIPSLAPDQP